MKPACRLCVAAFLFACVATQTAFAQSNETEGACDASEGSPEATCAVCLTSGDVDFQVCCCSPYPALVTTSPNESTCECRTKAGWALILLAILVPVLIIGDIILILYCCYKGKCCCFKPKAKQEQNYNVHMGLAEPETPLHTPSAKPMVSGQTPMSTPPPMSPPIMAQQAAPPPPPAGQRAGGSDLRVPAPPQATRPPSTYHASPQRHNAI